MPSKKSPQPSQPDLNKLADKLLAKIPGLIDPIQPPVAVALFLSFAYNALHECNPDDAAAMAANAITLLQQFTAKPLYGANIR